MRKIDGKALADALRADVKKDVASLPVPPTLGVILVGDDPASQTYVSLKEKAATEAGIRTDVRRLPAATPDEEVVALIRAWNADPNVNAILLQLPLPAGHDADALIAAMDPAKDVDGFHPENVRALLAGEGHVLSPVHEGVMRLIASTGMDARQKHAALIANSEVFAAPLSYILDRAGFLVDRLGPDDVPSRAVAAADVIIIAVGKPHLLAASMVKDGAVVIDVGTTRLPDGRIVGDADKESFKTKEGWLTPVPGGVGPMTVALLLKNVVHLAKSRRT